MTGEPRDTGSVAPEEKNKEIFDVEIERNKFFSSLQTNLEEGNLDEAVDLYEKNKEKLSLTPDVLLKKLVYILNMFLMGRRNTTSEKWSSEELVDSVDNLAKFSTKVGLYSTEDGFFQEVLEKMSQEATTLFDLTTSTKGPALIQLEKVTREMGLTLDNSILERNLPVTLENYLKKEINYFVTATEKVGVVNFLIFAEEHGVKIDWLQLKEKVLSDENIEGTEKSDVLKNFFEQVEQIAIEEGLVLKH
ncbi:MAG: hypothetical protein COU28_01290 [Candidatus Magasanikbacteria bacterium CG10_big_fil_rev_8_21_14_0_10_36_16]|uniref:Uncharacterized protein n=1 Tax=Candidatus Magasanikbacteria bacterium CG10_big_fil_rev_8_21_14_0_10_36_16 TaxID=1974645 RepID=A0A2H0TZ45_9BACT|nr:MAG: hypothetical protein COU28_01290 [Candidatus Magasanikbacteria bacterium CG10_big_fil_rev_8_21_14_0_10_36_16]